MVRVGGGCGVGVVVGGGSVSGVVSVVGVVGVVGFGGVGVVGRVVGRVVWCWYSVC